MKTSPQSDDFTIVARTFAIIWMGALILYVLPAPNNPPSWFPMIGIAYMVASVFLLGYLWYASYELENTQRFSLAGINTLVYFIAWLIPKGGFPLDAFAHVIHNAPMFMSMAVIAIPRKKHELVTKVQPNAAPSDDMRDFFGILYADGRGWVEVSYIDGDPRPGFDKMRRAGWHFYRPGGKQALIEWCQQLAQQYGNVYVSNTLYSERKRSAAVALPSHIVFIDDAPASDDYSAVVRTSEHSRHAYFVLDQATTPDERRDVQRRAARALGADKSGADITQLVRVPGSFNTKAHGRWPVQLESFTDRVYTLSELRERWPTAPDQAVRLGNAAGLDWAQVEHWLGNIDKLLRDGLPRRMKNPRGQARRVLDGTLQAPSTSDARAWVAKGLILHRYPDEEAAALLLHFCDYGISDRKGSAWLEQDVTNLIALYRAERPDIMPEPSYTAAPNAPAQRPQRKPSRAGRRVVITLGDAYEKLQALVSCNNVVCEPRSAIAAAWGVSKGTVDRRLDDMAAMGWIERATLKTRRALRLMLTKEADSGVITIESPAPQKADFNFDHDMPVSPTTEPTPTAEPAVHEGTHPPDLARLSLRELVAEGLDTYGAHLRRVLWHVQRNGGDLFASAAIERTYRAELNARRWARQSARQVAKLPTLRYSELKKRATSAGHHAAKLKREQKPAAGWWMWYAGQLEAEITRRDVTNQARLATVRAATPVTAQRPAAHVESPTPASAEGVALGGCVPSPATAAGAPYYERHGSGWRARVGELVTSGYSTVEAAARAVVRGDFLPVCDAPASAATAQCITLKPSSAARFRVLSSALS